MAHSVLEEMKILFSRHLFVQMILFTVVCSGEWNIRPNTFILIHYTSVHTAHTLTLTFTCPPAVQSGNTNLNNDHLKQIKAEGETDWLSRFNVYTNTI